MALSFKKKDYYAFTASLLVILFGGLVGHVMGWTQPIEAALRFVTAGAILVGLLALRRNLPKLDGEYARNMEMIGIGTAFFLVSWLPHIGWHVEQRPTMLGLNQGFWAGFFHSWNAVSFLVITYGIYMFHRSVSGRGTDFSMNGPLNLHLGRRDYGFLAAAFAVVLFSASVGQFTGFTEMLAAATTYIQLPFIIAGLYYIYRLRDWGGEVGRSLQLVGVGLMMIMVNWVPHIPWHINGMPSMGVSPGFWLGLFHSWVIAGFLMISYALNEI